MEHYDPQWEMLLSPLIHMTGPLDLRKQSPRQNVIQNNDPNKNCSNKRN